MMLVTQHSQATFNYIEMRTHRKGRVRTTIGRIASNWDN
uniref:Uncharacterized protein n=1 Tax=Arundo donax TaxID=35708 RepID=A0A0A8ZP56_ARUDO